MSDVQKMLSPKTVALIGASDKPASFGKALLQNLLLSAERRIFPVNPCWKSLFNIPAYPNVSSIPEQIDLAVIATPASTVPAVVDECGKAGVAGAVILSSGFREIGKEGELREKELKDLIKHYAMRIMGPNCLGFIRPHIGLNATPLATNPLPGNIAFVSQSGAFGRALMEWAIDAHIGFSMFASLGAMIDVELGDMIDFLGTDPHTRSIMVYVEEGIGDAKRFMSAARGFARNKPIVVLKPARRSDHSEQAKSHTGYLATSDRVYDAVFKRAGVVRVKTAEDLFNTAGVLYSKHLPKGPRLLVLTNAFGIGMMAVNTLDELGGEAAALSVQSLDELKRFFPPYWNEGEPLDLLRDADVARYCEVIKICLKDEGVDGVLIIFTPQGAAEAGELAAAIAEIGDRAGKPIITAWMGGREAREGREIFVKNNIPTYDTPERAVKTYLYMYSHERNLGILHETPSDVPVDPAPPKNTLKALTRRVLAEGRTTLTEEESKRFLADYGIPVVKTYVARSVEQAVNIGKSEGYPLVLKIISPDISYKSDSGGVALNIMSEGNLRGEYQKMMDRVSTYSSGCTIKGVTVQKMIEKVDYEIILGAKKDDNLGSVILFGTGGTEVQVCQDFSIGLPPLNQVLARKLMEETRVYRLLQGYRGKPPADLGSLERIILSFSNLIADFPEIAEMDINPIAIAGGKAIALDARVVLDPNYSERPSSHPHLIISPYPVKYTTHWALPSGADVLLRPIRPEDEPLEHEMLTSLSEKTLKERFFQVIKQIPRESHVRMCNIDYEKEMAIVAEIREGNRRRMIGMGRLVFESDAKKAELAVVVHDAFQSKGLGYKLVDTVIGIAHEKGVEEIYGYVLSDNTKMLNMCVRLGCLIKPLEEGITKVALQLE